MKGFFSCFVVLEAVLVLQRCSAQSDAVEEWLHYDIDDMTVSTGENHACALAYVEGLDVGGEVVCWGTNKNGQSSPPEGYFVQLSVGTRHSCGLTIDEEIRCWGEPHLTKVKPGHYIQVSAGDTFTCGILKDRTLQCWGSNTYKESVPPEGEFVQVSCAGRHACAIRTDGKLVCWGHKPRAIDFPVPEDEFVQVSVAARHSACGIRVNGSVVCWGFGFTSVNAVSDAVTNLVDDKVGYTQISTGQSFACGITESSVIRCIGNRANILGKQNNALEALELSVQNTNLCYVPLDEPHDVTCFGPITMATKPEFLTAVQFDHVWGMCDTSKPVIVIDSMYEGGSITSQ